MNAKHPPITAWAVVYPTPMGAYSGGRYALFLDKSTAEMRAVGARGAELRTLAEVPQQAIDEAVVRERAHLLKKFDGYVPADQVSSLQWRVRELEAQIAGTNSRPVAIGSPAAALAAAQSDSEGGHHD